MTTFRFYEELNDFLPPERRQREFDCHCAETATVKHMIEALGVPHTEVELVLVNGESVPFGRRLLESDLGRGTESSCSPFRNRPVRTRMPGGVGAGG